MFDLFRSRAKAVRYLLGGLLMLVAISMVVTLIPGYGTGGSANDQVIAEVGKDAVTVREVQSQLQNATRNRQIPAEMMSIFAPQVIDQLITERAMVYEAHRLGFDVTETELAQALRSALPQLFQNGQFVGNEVYAAFLNQQNLTIPEFEASFRRQLLLNKLRTLILQGVVVTPQEIEREFKRRNEKVKLEYIMVPLAKFRSQVSPAPDQIKARYESNKSSYQVPERRSFEVLIADEPKFAARITVPEEQLRKMYDANKDQFRTPERVHARHILLKTTDKPQADIPKIQAKAEDLLKQLKNGADFAELAKKNSEDTGSAEKGGELGWVVKGQTVKNFEDAAFSLPVKQLSGVIKTEYGFHIIQVLEKEQARLKPFEEVKDQLAQEVKKQQVYDTMQRSIDQARDQLAKNPQQAQQIAQQNGLELIPANNVKSGDAIPGVGPGGELWDAVASTKKGGVTPVVQIAGNKLATAVVTDVQPARQAELAEVEGQIRDALTTELAQALVLQKAREAADKVRQTGDLKAVAKSLGLEVKTTQEFTREGAADGIGPASYVEQAFGKQPGYVFGPVAVNTDQVVARVASSTPPDMSQLASQRENLLSELKNQKQRQRNELFEDSLRSRLIQDGKVKIHEDAVKRLVASYRG